MDEVIRVEGLTKNFGPLQVLRGIDCSVKPKEVVCVIGPSGSGKSTFLRCLNGLEEASGGRVLGVTALGCDASSARYAAYAAAGRVHFENAFYRRDIGARAIATAQQGEN